MTGRIREDKWSWGIGETIVSGFIGVIGVLIVLALQILGDIKSDCSAFRQALKNEEEKTKCLSDMVRYDYELNNKLNILDIRVGNIETIIHKKKVQND